VQIKMRGRGSKKKRHCSSEDW